MLLLRNLEMRIVLSLFEILSSAEAEREARRTSLFADNVVEEGALEIDEGVAERSVSLNPPFVLSFEAA